MVCDPCFSQFTLALYLPLALPMTLNNDLLLCLILCILKYDLSDITLKGLYKRHDSKLSRIPGVSSLKGGLVCLA